MASADLARLSSKRGTILALVMALVAMIGATIAYRTAVLEDRTSFLESRLSQGEMFELGEVQKLLNGLVAYNRFLQSYRKHLDNATFLHSEAEEQQRHHSVDADRLELESQEEYALSRTLRPFVEFTKPSLGRKLISEETLTQTVARYLSKLGFEATLLEKDTSTPLRSSDSQAVNEQELSPPGIEAIWEKLSEQIDQSEQRTLRLAKAVVIMVFALAFLTGAHLLASRPRWQLLVSVAGVFLGLYGLAWALLSDSDRWPYVFTIGFALLAFALMKFPWLERIREVVLDPSQPESEPIHPGELEPTLNPGPRLHIAPPTHRFNRWVVLLVVITVLASAFSGCWYSQTASMASGQASDAFKHELKLVIGNALSAKQPGKEETPPVYYTLDALANAEVSRVRYQAAQHRINLAQHRLANVSDEDAVRDRNLWSRALRTAQSELSGTDNELDADPRFPRGFFFRHLGDQAERELALWDASNELNLALRKSLRCFSQHSHFSQLLCTYSANR